MKELLKVIILTATLQISFVFSTIYAQEIFEMSPKSTEKIIGYISESYYAGEMYMKYVYKEGLFSGHWEWDDLVDKRKTFSKKELYEKLLSSAKDRYKNYPKLVLRNFKYEKKSEDKGDKISGNVKKEDLTEYYYHCSATVVVGDPKLELQENLYNAIDKSFRNIRQGSRIAIDQVTVPINIDRDVYKDKMIDILLDKGYKVVAKEYLQKLYEEQLSQQSGIYNDRTTVQENNFSAVGYFVNVKLTEISLRIQVINVSTGEYESNATITF